MASAFAATPTQRLARRSTQPPDKGVLPETMREECNITRRCLNRALHRARPFQIEMEHVFLAGLYLAGVDGHRPAGIDNHDPSPTLDKKNKLMPNEPARHPGSSAAIRPSSSSAWSCAASSRRTQP